jgi:hypothetical protein
MNCKPNTEYRTQRTQRTQRSAKQTKGYWMFFCAFCVPFASSASGGPRSISRSRG